MRADDLARSRRSSATSPPAARRAREAGLGRRRGPRLQRLPDHAVSRSEINDRKDDYGGPLENRARFALEIVRAIRAAVGTDFHLQFKISAVEHQTRCCPGCAGNTLEESLQVCRGSRKPASTRSTSRRAACFRIRATPPAELPIEELVRTYDTDALERPAYVSQLRPVPHAGPPAASSSGGGSDRAAAGVEGINLAAAAP